MGFKSAVGCLFSVLLLTCPFQAKALEITRMGSIEIQDSQPDGTDEDESEEAAPKDENQLFGELKKKVRHGKSLEGKCSSGKRFSVISYGNDEWSWKGPAGSGSFKPGLYDGIADAAFVACGEKFSPFVPRQQVVQTPTPSRQSLNAQ